MSNSMNITEVRIGRNVDNTPMSDDRWASFQADVVAALRAFVGYAGLVTDQWWTEVHTGVGTWVADDGTVVTEQSAVVTLYWSSDVRPSALEQLELDASILARRYQQDAVAVVHGGRSTLVAAKAVAL